MLDEAKATCGATPALLRRSPGLCQKPGGDSSLLEPDITPRTAWEHYDLGRSYLRSGLVSEAALEFQRAGRIPSSRFLVQLFPGPLRV